MRRTLWLLLEATAGIVFVACGTDSNITVGTRSDGITIYCQQGEIQYQCYPNGIGLPQPGEYPTGGGGKRVAHSFEHYDRDSGISVFCAPSVKPGYFLYFDPIDTLAPEVQARWRDEAEQQRMVEAAIAAARGAQAKHARASSIK